MSENRVRLNNVRLSFISLDKARDYQNDGKFKYFATLLMPKDGPEHKKCLQAMKAAASAKWGADKAVAMVKAVLASGAQKCALQDGEIKAATHEGFDGMMALKASARPNTPPKLLDNVAGPDGKALTLPQDTPKIYAGCYANCVVEFWASSNNGNGIYCSLAGVQFAKDGDAFGGGRAADADEFEASAAPETEDEFA